MPLTPAEKQKRYRQRKSNETVTVTPENVTETIEESVTEYLPIVAWLENDHLRASLKAIYQSLHNKKLDKDVWFGAGGYGQPFDMIGEMIDIVEGKG